MDDLIATRTKLRSKATKLCNEFQTYRKTDRASIDSDQLALKLQHLSKVQGELHGVQAQLDKVGQSDESTHLQTVEDEIFLGSRVLSRLEEAEKAQSKGSSWNAELKSSITVKIPTFHGDAIKWPEFWELYTLSVHNNSSYANVQKFVVLKSHLAGVALRAIQGIPVTGDGYGQAIAVLKDRFERDEERKEALMKELLNIPVVRMSHVMSCHVTCHMRHVTIFRSWVSRVPRQKGRPKSRIHQGPRPWTQQTLDLGSFWDLGTSLIVKCNFAHILPIYDNN